MFHRRRRRSKTRKKNPDHSLALLESIEINASADVVWEVLLNVQAYDGIFQTCRSVENLNLTKSLNPVQPGAIYVEQRTIEGRDFRFETAVTVVKVILAPQDDDDDDDDDSTSTSRRRIFALATNLWQSTGTSTHTLQDLTPNSCRLEITYGMVPNGLYGKCYTLMFRKRILREGSLSILSDLADIQAAAEERRADKM